MVTKPLQDCNAKNWKRETTRLFFCHFYQMINYKCYTSNTWMPRHNSSHVHGLGSTRQQHFTASSSGAHVTDEETGTWWLNFTQCHTPVHAGSWVALERLSPSPLHWAELGVAAHIWNPSSEEAKAAGWWVQGQARLHSETLSRKTMK